MCAPERWLVKEGRVSLFHLPSLHWPPSLLTHVPRNATSAVSQKKELGCFKLKLLFKGDFILDFNVDMYLDFTAKFDILQQPHPSPPPSFAATQWSCPFSPWCGAVPAFPSACSLRSKGVNSRPNAPTNLLLRSTVTCFWTGMSACQNVPFQRCENRRTPKMVGLLPESREGATGAVASVNRIALQLMPEMTVPCPAAAV